jgi:hypothetical protein
VRNLVSLPLLAERERRVLARYVSDYPTNRPSGICWGKTPIFHRRKSYGGLRDTFGAGRGAGHERCSHGLRQVARIHFGQDSPCHVILPAQHPRKNVAVYPVNKGASRVVPTQIAAGTSGGTRLGSKSEILAKYCSPVDRMQIACLGIISESVSFGTDSHSRGLPSFKLIGTTITRLD